MEYSGMLVIGGLKEAIQNNFTNIGTKIYACVFELRPTHYVGISKNFVFIRVNSWLNSLAYAR